MITKYSIEGDFGKIFITQGTFSYVQIKRTVIFAFLRHRNTAAAVGNRTRVLELINADTLTTKLYLGGTFYNTSLFDPDDTDINRRFGSHVYPWICST